MKKLTKEEILYKCNNAHNNFYGYNLSSFNSINDYATIICPIHGNFIQLLRDHIHKKCGCQVCSRIRGNTSRSLNTNIFIEKGTNIYNGFYLYGKSIYKNSRTKIIITCPNHGDFEQLPISHLRGFKCKQCGNEDVAVALSSTTNDFSIKSKAIHNNFYDYSKTIYTNNNTYVIIICPNHGEFLQTPASHLNGSGCPTHAIESSRIKRVSNTQEFTTKANIVHNNFYGYLKTKYETAFKKIIITCPEHGDFNQNPGAHLMGTNCPKCVKSVSKKETIWLNSLNIQHRSVRIKTDKRSFVVDGFDPKTNSIYEFYGDYWHGNPNKFNSTDFNKTVKKTFGELYNETVLRENLLKEAGYNIISMWENNFIMDKKCD